MCRLTMAILTILLCVRHAPALPAVDKVRSIAANQAGVVAISSTRLAITDKTLEWHYRITNRSDRDIWLCEGTSRPEGDFDVYLAEDGETLMIRRHVYFPPEDPLQDLGYWDIYTRLRPGQSRDESLRMSLPVYWRSYFPTPEGQDRSVLASRLVLEIGFHAGDLLQTILRAYEEYEPDYQFRVPRLQHNLARLIVGNEGISDREDRIEVAHRPVILKDSQKLRICLDNQAIPYGGFRTRNSYPTWPDLTRCTRMEFCFQPSMLDYFYPDPREQALLDSAEKEHLRSQKTLSMADQQQIWDATNELRRGASGRIIVPGSTCRVVCYGGDTQLLSFVLRGENGLDREDGEGFKYEFGLRMPRHMSPLIKPYELRVGCARNLRDLWYRLRFYHRVRTAPSSDQGERAIVVYPPTQAWCSDLADAYDSMPESTVARPYICPSAPEGRCHYAMNPDCGADSAGDIVLLFETKAGWNQYGGPELFTFDNHDPRGGCVLLNDGTVKFIRTEEELHALRWKQADLKNGTGL